jgi:hypothetical protein
MYFATTDAYVTGSKTRMYISEVGNVGIGTTAPGAKLDVIAETRISYATSSQYRVRITNSDGNGRILVDGSESALIFGTSAVGVNATATEKMRITAAGNVGINTTNPLGGKLHVYNSTGIFEGPSSGASVINSNTFGIQVGPTRNRLATASTYYPGIAFNHLLNYSGVTTYNVAPQGWIGLRLVDTPGSERSSLVFATKEGTGYSDSGTDIPTERSVSLPSATSALGRRSLLISFTCRVQT